MKNFYNKKKVLITGHTGFKGSWMSNILYLMGANVTGIALEPNTTPSIFNILNIKNKIAVDNNGILIESIRLKKFLMKYSQKLLYIWQLNH